MSDDWKEKLAKATGYEGSNFDKSKRKREGGERSMQIRFYSDVKNKVMSHDLLDEQAHRVAKKLAHKLKSTQLRKFHNHIRELEAKIELEGEENFRKKMLPLVKMVKSKVAYACPKKVPYEFRNLMESMINQIDDKKDFETFSLCFEAIVGYFYGEGG
ncbi:MAG: type III-A CRISPR-associated protein Csm2 [bacterium]